MMRKMLWMLFSIVYLSALQLLVLSKNQLKLSTTKLLK